MVRREMVDIAIGAQVNIYPASVSENSFNKAIWQNFHAGLGSASLVRDYGLERETPLFEAEGMTLRMHYKRYRFGELGRKELTLAYKRVHPDFVSKDEMQQNDVIDLLDVPSKEEEVVDLLGLNKHYDPGMLLIALITQGYLGHGLTVTSWPEELGFEIFNKPPDQLEKTKGLGNFVVIRGDDEKWIRPLFQGRLLIAPRFGDENISTVETALVLENPLLEQIKATAFAGTYYPEGFGDVAEIIKRRRAVEEKNWPEVRVIENRRPYSLGSFAPDQAAANFVAFAKGLVSATQSL